MKEEHFWDCSCGAHARGWNKYRITMKMSRMHESKCRTKGSKITISTRKAGDKSR